MTQGVRCMLMRGGTSKGLYFLGGDLPAEPSERDRLLLALMGSGHPLQVDGLGGGHPLASKVAVVSRPADREADLDYLFLQLGVDEATITDRQNCGNILAGVGPFAAERGLIEAGGEQTTTRIRMVNSGSLVTATFATPGGRPDYAGDTAIAGVPGTAAAVLLRFAGTEGSATGRLLPTGQVRDVVEGTEVTCVDNGMPVVVARAADLGVTGTETPAELAADRDLAARVQSLRLAAGALMGLGDVLAASVPKTTLVSAPSRGGTIGTRTFIPVRPHTAIGVLGAVSVATALLLPCAVGAELAEWPASPSAAGPFPGGAARGRAGPARHRAPIRAPRGRGRRGHRGQPAASAQRGRDPDRTQVVRRDRLPGLYRLSRLARRSRQCHRCCTM